MPSVDFQPKQSRMYRLVADSQYPVIGVGGGRGAAKSSGADRVAITLMHERPGTTVCMVMRTWVKQMVPFHLEAIRRDFPWLSPYMTASPPAMLRPPNTGGSRLEFKYAENYDAVEEAFRSGNYDLIIVDQAEQFSWRELVEIRKAARSKGGKQAKVLLLFNMRGAGIADLRKVFHTHDVANPEDFTFLKVNPWDNVEWVKDALERQGFTVKQYYSWTDEQRKAYAAEFGPYTKQLASDDPVIAKADWEGDWDSLEGAYFANSFDLEAVRITPSQVAQLMKDWAEHWMAQDWGRTHWCATGWAFRITLKPSEALSMLGWTLIKPINVTVIYREMVCREKEAPEVAQDILDCMLADEKAKIRSFFLSPEEVTDAANSIGNQQSRVLRKSGVPGPTKADNDRKGGYGLLSSLFKASKGQGWGVDKEGKRFQYDDAILISSECAELLKAIPALLRDPKNLDDVLKTDLSAAKLEQDMGDMARYLTKSMLRPKSKPQEAIDRDRLLATETIAERSLLQFKLTMEKEARERGQEERRPAHWE